MIVTCLLLLAIFCGAVSTMVLLGACLLVVIRDLIDARHARSRPSCQVYALDAYRERRRIA